MARVVKFDFAPVAGGTYDLDWPGPPRRAITYADVEHFRPVIEFDTAMETEWFVDLWIKEARTVWRDPTLGSVRALFQAGATAAHDFQTDNHSAGSTPPAGSPAHTDGSFWLGVTKKGKIRGNLGKENNGKARVYLETPSVIGDARAPRLPYATKSRMHTVRRVG